MYQNQVTRMAGLEVPLLHGGKDRFGGNHAGAVAADGHRLAVFNQGRGAGGIQKLGGAHIG